MVYRFIVLLAKSTFRVFICFHDVDDKQVIYVHPIIYIYHNVAAILNRYLRLVVMLVVMMTVTMTIAQKTKTPLMKITTMS